MTLDVTSCYRKRSLFVPTRYQHVHHSNMLRFGASKDDKSSDRKYSSNSWTFSSKQLMQLRNVNIVSGYINGLKSYII